MSYEHAPDENPENLDPNVVFLADLDHQMDILAELHDVNTTMEEIYLDGVNPAEQDPTITPDARAAVELLEIDEAFSLMQAYEAEARQAAEEAAARLLIESVFGPHPDVVDFEDKVRGMDYFLRDYPEATTDEKDQIAAEIFNPEPPKASQNPALHYKRIRFGPAPEEKPDMVSELYKQRQLWPLHERSTPAIEVLRQYPGLLLLVKEVAEGYREQE